MLNSQRIGGIADIAHGHDPVPVHFLFGEAHTFLLSFFRRFPLLDHLLHKFNQAGLGLDGIFHMAQFQVAMGVDETGGEQTCQTFYIIAGCTCINQFNDPPRIIGDQHRIPFQDPMAVEYMRSG